MPFNKDGKRKPMMYGKKKPMMYGKKPMLADLSGDGKVTKKDVMIGRDVPGFEKGMDKKAMMYGKKPKAYKPMKHKGPYMMKPGSREKDTPGSFRQEVAPMYYGKKPMMFKASKNPMMTGKKSNIDPDLVKEAVRDFKVRPPKTQGDSIQLTSTMRKAGKDPQSVTDSRFRFYEKAGPKGGLKSMKEKIAEAKAKRGKK